jgi:hypothetical protein
VTFRICLCALVLACAVPAAAQDRPALGSRVGNGAPVNPPAGPVQPSTYDDGGRRDPFVSLLTPKKAPAPVSQSRAGLVGLVMADVVVKGIVRTGGTTVAILEAPDGKSFVARTKDRLQDAVIKAIDAGGVTFVEQVVDVLGAAHSREVRKALRPAAGGEGVR